jgi:hypothetical protein
MYDYDHRLRKAVEGTLEMPPTYRGKPLRSKGGDVWVLEAPEFVVIAEYNEPGWSVRFSYGSFLKPVPGTTHGRDLEEIIDGLIDQELARIDEGHKRLETRRRSLNLLKG